MDLAELNFKANTKELLDAVNTIDKVTAAVKRMNDVHTKSSSTSSDQSATTKLTKDGHKAVETTDKVTHALEKQTEKMKIMRNEVISVSDGFVQLGDGFTNSQAGMLATIKLLGATESQMKALSASFKEYNKITGVNTFDKSAAGLEKLKKSIAEIGNVNKLAKEGLALTRTQLIDLNRDIERVTQAFTSSNNQVKISGQVYTNLDEAIKRLKTDFVGLATSVSLYEQEAKEAEAVNKRIASEKAASEMAAMKMNDDAVKLFIKNEQKKQIAMANTIRLQEESGLKQRLMQEKYTSGESSRIVTLTRGGVSEDDAKKEIESQRQVSAATREATRARQEATRVLKEKEAATRLVANMERSLSEQLNVTNNLTGKSTELMLKYERALKAVGLSTSEINTRLANFRTGLARIDLREKERDIRNLGRAMSTQMGDVAISLASGMNPLLIAVQQGDQIRFAMTQSSLAAKDMSKAMQEGAAIVARSIKDVTLIIGQFFVGAITSAGKNLNNFIGSLTGADVAAAKLAEKMKLMNTSTGIMTVGLYKTIQAFNLLTGILTAGAIGAMLGFTIALFKTIKEQDKLVSSLALTGGALGLTFDSALSYAEGMRSAGIATGKAIEVISEMGKTGVLTSKEIDMVSRSAVELERYGAVAISETVKVFADLKKEPVEALVKVAKETGMVTAASISLVHQLSEQGKNTDAAAEAMRIYADITERQLKRMKEEYSGFGLYIKKILEGSALLWDDVFKAMMRATPKKQNYIDQAAMLDQASLSPYVQSKPELLKKIIEQRNKFLELAKAEDAVAEATQKLTQEEQQRIKIQEETRSLDKKNKTDLDNYLQKMEELKEKVRTATRLFGAESAEVRAYYTEIRMLSEKQAKLLAGDMRPKHQNEKKALKELARAQEIYDDILGKSSGYTKEYNNQLEALNFLREKGKITQSEFYEAFEKLVNQQPFAIKLQKNLNKETEDYLKALELLDRIQGKDSGFNADYVPKVKQLIDAFQRGFFGEGNKGLAVLENAVTLLTKQQPLYTNREKAQEEINKLLLNSNKHLEDEEDTLNKVLSSYDQIETVQRDITIAAEREKKIRDIIYDIEKKILEVKSKKHATDEDKDSAIKSLEEDQAKRIELANRKAAQSYKEEFDKILRPIQEGLADAIVTGLFEGGKTGRKKLRDLVVNEIKKPITLVLNVFIKDLMNSILGGVGGNNGGSLINQAAGAAGGTDWSSVGGAISGVKSIYDIFTGGYEAAIGKAYASFATSSTGQALGLSVADTGGVVLTNAGSAGASVASTAGYGIAGYAAYKGISGGYETNKLVDVIGKFAGLFGPYGVVVSAIAGVINRAFGHKLKDAGVQGTLGGEAGFIGEQFKFFKGGFLTKDKTEKSDLDDDLEQFIGNQFKEVRASFLGFTEVLGINKEAIAGYTQEIKFSTKDFDSDPEKAAEQIGAKLQEEFEKSVEGMAKLALAGTNLRRGQESYVDTLTRLATTLKAVNQAMDNLGLTLFETSLSGADAATQFTDLFGGLDQATSALQNYYNNFYEQEEKIANATKGLTAHFESLGVVLPDTKEAFRELVEEADAAGNTKLVAKLIGVSDAFNQLMTDLGKDRSVEYYIDKINKVKRTNEEIAQNMISMQDEGKNLAVELLYATGQIEAADKAARELATKGMTNAEKALYDFNQSLREQIEVVNERINIENDILQLTGNTVELRKRELDVLDPTNRALKELFYTLQTGQQLTAAIDEQLPKFLPKDELDNLRYNQFGQTLLDAGILGGVAIEDLSAKIRTMSRDEIYDAVVEVMNMTHMTDEMRLTLVKTAGAIADYNDAVNRTRVEESLDAINKFVGDLSVIKEPTLTISESYVKNKGLLDNILDFFGVKTKNTIEDIVGTLLDQAQGLKDFRKGLAESIESARITSMSKPDRIKALKKREDSLYEELKTTNDPVGVANKLQSVILQRLQEEADLREEIRNKDKDSIEEIQKKKEDALRNELDALQRLKNLSNEIAQFTASLRFSDVSPLNYQDQLATAQSLFQSTLEKAKAGDEDAMGNLIENARAYIDEARSYFASSAEYAGIFHSVTGQLDALGLTGADVDPQIAALDKQLKEIEKVSKGLEDNELAIRETAAAQLVELNKLDVAVAAREDKTKELLVQQRDLLDTQVKQGYAQLKQWTEIANALLAELAVLNNTSAKTLEQVKLEAAAP